MVELQEAPMLSRAAWRHDGLLTDRYRGESHLTTDCGPGAATRDLDRIWGSTMRHVSRYSIGEYVIQLLWTIGATVL